LITNNENSIDDFEPIVILKKYAKQLEAVNSVKLLFSKQVYPFIEMIFQDYNSNEAMNMAKNIEKYVEKYALKNITLKTENFLKQLINSGIEKKENLPLTACNYYFTEGSLNHVLMGVRKQEYVQSLNGKFSSNNSIGLSSLK
jgi:hypothetical protein